MTALAQRVIRAFLVLTLVWLGGKGTFFDAWAEKVGRVSQIMCTRSKEVNLRRGPGQQYPIDWKIVKARYPLKVMAEYGTWRKVQDCDGVQGWVHQNMLTAKPRRAVITFKTTLFLKPLKGDSVIAYVEPKVLVNILEIRPGWCRIEVEGHRGWVARKHLWGILDNE